MGGEQQALLYINSLIKAYKNPRKTKIEVEGKEELGFGSAQLEHRAVPVRQKGKTLRSTKWLRDEARPHLHFAFPLTLEE